MAELTSAEDAPALYSIDPDGEHIVLTLHDEGDATFRFPIVVASWLGRDLTSWARAAAKERWPDSIASNGKGL